MNNDHYEDHEICLIWQTEKSRENAKALAKILGRTEAAIDWIWRHCEVVATKGLEGVGPRVSKHLVAQIYLWGWKRLGPKRRGVIKTMEVSS